MARRLCREDYTVGWVCVLPVELAAAQGMLDEEDETPQCDAYDTNIYTCGRVGEHNVVIACLRKGPSTNSAATAAIQMKSTFTSTRFGLLVGIGGGVPSEEADVRLGDIVVSKPHKVHGGVVQYNLAKARGLERTGFLDTPPTILLNAVTNLRAKYMRREGRLLEYFSKLDSLPGFSREAAGEDTLFEASYDHIGGATCSACSKDCVVHREARRQEVVVHYGTIASSNHLIRNAAERERLSAELGSVLCFEIEAAGLMNSFPCLVIRGICDYADSHKNKRWQAYAAGRAAAYAKEVLSVIPAVEMAETHPVDEAIRETVRLQKEIKRPSEERVTAPPLDVQSNRLELYKRNEPRFGCQTCNRTFRLNEAANQHMEAKQHWSRFTCQTCGKNFGSDQAVNQHMDMKHHWSQPKCQICSRTFGSNQAANQHMIAVGHRGSYVSYKTSAKKTHTQRAVYQRTDAFVNAQGGECGNGPQTPSAKGHEQVGKLLLDKHANTTAQDGKFTNGLKVALEEGHKQAVKPMLEVIDTKAASVGAPTDSGYASQSRAEALFSQMERNETPDPDKDEEGIENLSDNAIKSVDFDSVDIGSEESRETTPVENEGKAHLAQFLAYDPELGSLCAKVLSKIGRDRFANSFRKLLKSFYRNLLQTTVTEREQISVHLLQSRRGRLRIGSAIANHLDTDEENDPGKMRDLAEERRVRAEHLNDWLENMPQLVSDTTVHQKLELPIEENQENDHDCSSSEDLYSEFGCEEAKLPHLTDMERFFRNSRSFQTLLNDVRKLLLPRFVMQIIQTIPKHRIWLSMWQNQSPVNRTKAFIEDYTQLDWDWWPLKPRMRLLKDNETRLFWQCFCGARLWKEISLEEAELINQILSSLDKSPPWPHRCKVKKNTISWIRHLASIIRTPMPRSSASQRYSPAISSVSSSTTGQASQSFSIGQSNANQNQSQQQQAVIASQQPIVASIRPTPEIQSWVLFGVQGSRRTLEINHIMVHNHSNDSSFYCSLRKHYRANRGRIRLWFSFWRLDYCEVVKFKRIAPEWIIKDCKDLPSDPEYIYAPRPPQATNPPISRHEFSMHLNACEHPCRWSFLHECMPQLDTSSAIACIPKRRKEFDTASNSPTDVYAWGLEAKHVISAAYVAIYHIIIFLLPFGFWGWWIKEHPDDLQGASVPVTVVFGLLSLFWSTNGILTQGRQLATH